MATDVTLVNEFEILMTEEPKDGMHSAPADLLESHGDFLYRFAMIRLNDQYLAEEVVQETLLKAIAKFDTFRRESSLRTWLAQILRNEIATLFRRKKRDQSLQDKIENEANVSLSDLLNPKVNTSEFTSEVEKGEFWTTVRACYSKLPDHLLETFLMKWRNQDQKTEDICKELGINPSNFAVRMFRARILLRKCLESTWFEGRLGDQ